MNMYAFLTVLFVGILIPSGRAYSESDLDETDLHCLKELNLDKKVVIESYDENDFIREGNSQMNNFYTCAWKKDKLQNNDGSINRDNLQVMIERLLEHKKLVQDANERKNVAKQGIDHCKDVKGSDDGDTCVKIYNCLLKHIVAIVNN